MRAIIFNFLAAVVLAQSELNDFCNIPESPFCTCSDPDEVSTCKLIPSCAAPNDTMCTCDQLCVVPVAGCTINASTCQLSSYCTESNDSSCQCDSIHEPATCRWVEFDDMYDQPNEAEDDPIEEIAKENIEEPQEEQKVAEVTEDEAPDQSTIIIQDDESTELEQETPQEPNETTLGDFMQNEEVMLDETD